MITTEQLKVAVTKAIEKHNEEEAEKDFIDRFIEYVSHWWQWTDGQRSEKGGYKIMTLFAFTRRIWFGLIRYQPGNFQPLHRDPLRKGYEGHFKINIELWAAKGSDFITLYPHYQLGRLHIFWAHHNPHEVTAVESGVRYVLSFSVFTKKFNPVEDDDFYRKCYLHQQKLAENCKSYGKSTIANKLLKVS